MKHAPQPRIERVQSREAAAMTGLSIRAIQSLAKQGKMPGAAKLGSVWTFDVDKLRRLVRQKEVDACQRTFMNETASSMPEYKLAAKNIDEAYERAIGRKPVDASISG